MKKGGPFRQFTEVFGLWKRITDYKVLTYIIPFRAGDFTMKQSNMKVQHYIRDMKQEQLVFKYFPWTNSCYGL